MWKVICLFLMRNSEYMYKQNIYTYIYIYSNMKIMLECQNDLFWNGGMQYSAITPSSIFKIVFLLLKTYYGYFVAVNCSNCFTCVNKSTAAWTFHHMSKLTMITAYMYNMFIMDPFTCSVTSSTIHCTFWLSVRNKSKVAWSFELPVRSLLWSFLDFTCDLWSSREAKPTTFDKVPSPSLPFLCKIEGTGFSWQLPIKNPWQCPN